MHSPVQHAIVLHPAVADFQVAKERKSLVLEALFEVLFRVLKHAAGGPGAAQQKQPPQQRENGAAADGASWCPGSRVLSCMLRLHSRQLLPAAPLACM